MKLTIPFYLHKAGAGFPSPATDYIEEDVDLNVHLIKNVPATFIIRVQGKSMTDVGIYDGDLLVIDRSLKPKNFSTVVANVHDELVVKSFVKSKDGQFLTSGSKNIQDKIIIGDEMEVFIWGVVTSVSIIPITRRKPGLPFLNIPFCFSKPIPPLSAPMMMWSCPAARPIRIGRWNSGW